MESLELTWQFSQFGMVTFCKESKWQINILESQLVFELQLKNPI